MTYCKDCKKHDKNDFGHICVLRESRSNVSGEVDRVHTGLCEWLRGNPTKCGKEAKWFEAKQA